MMIKTSLTLLVLLAATTVGIGQDTRINPSLVKARYQVSEKLFQDAVTTLESGQPELVDPLNAALTMGKALSGLKRFEDSNAMLLQVTGDGAAEACYLLAKNYLALNDFPSAIQYLSKHLAHKNHYAEKHIKKDPDFSKLENSREWVHLWQKEWYSSAEQMVAEGEYLLSQTKTDEAVALINQVLDIFPNEPRAWFLQARVYSLLNNSRLFMQSFERAWQLATGNSRLQEEILRFALENKIYDKANTMANELIRKDPSNPEYLISRALVRILEGQESLAMKEISAIEEAGIAPAELYFQAGRKIISTSPVQAESYLSKAIATGSLDARYYAARGSVRSSLDKMDLALEDMAMSLDINPYQPDLYFERAQIRLDRGDTQGACHDWRKALGMGHAKAADQLYKYCRLP